MEEAMDDRGLSVPGKGRPARRVRSRRGDRGGAAKHDGGLQSCIGWRDHVSGGGRVPHKGRGALCTASP